MSSLRNFGIAFILSLLALAAAAYFSMGVVASLFDPDDQVEISGEKREVKHFDDEIGSGISNEIKSGRSFNALFIGTDYDPEIYDYSPDDSGRLVVPRRVKVTTVYFVRFDKEKRSLLFSCIPASTVVSVDYVDMTLADVYAFKGASFISDQVSALTGVSIDFLFEFSGRQFTASRPKTPYVVPVSIDIPSYKGLQGASFTKGDMITDSNAFYTYIHYDDFDLAGLPDRAEILKSIFIQTAVKLATDDPAVYFRNIAPLTTNMTVNDVSDLLEVLTTLPLFVDSSKNKTQTVDLEFYKCGTFDGNGIFTPDREMLQTLFANCKMTAKQQQSN